jgi:hypothetical protein
MPSTAGRFRGPGNAWTLTLRTRYEVPDVESARDFLTAQFQPALGNRTEMPVHEIKRDATLSGLFELAAFADRNGDDRLSMDELTLYTDLAAAAMQSQVWVGLRDRGFNLLPFLDADADARLSYVELSRAHLLGDKETNKLPRQYEVSFSSAPVRSWGGMMMPGSRNRLKEVPRTGPTGPQWFEALDRNADGVVTPREFLGPPSVFKSVDSNDDGIVSVDEADLSD